MEENNNTEQITNMEETDKAKLKEKNYWKEHLSMLCAAFLGGFLAMYFVADQIFDNHRNVKYFVPDKMERKMLKDFEKMYELDRKAMEQSFSDFSDFNDNLMKQHYKKTRELQEDFSKIFSDTTIEGVNIKSELDDDEYKVIIDLKSFQGDENTINYNVSGRKLTVFGKSTVKDKNYEHDISFSHDYLLPHNADIANIMKKKEKNKLIIEVPLKNNSKD